MLAPILPFGSHIALQGLIAAGDTVLLATHLDNGTPLNACEPRYGWTLLRMAVEAKQYDCARLLLEHGADPHIVDYAGQTVLSAAFYHGDCRMIALLYKYGADPHVLVNGENPCAYWVVQNDSPALMRLLFRKQVSHKVKAATNLTLIDLAEYHSAKYLLAFFAERKLFPSQYIAA